MNYLDNITILFEVTICNENIIILYSGFVKKMIIQLENSHCTKSLV